MTFRDIERVRGELLPKSARRPEWWADEQGSGIRHVQCKAWLIAGYDAKLFGDGVKVRFTRREP